MYREPRQSAKNEPTKGKMGIVSLQTNWCNARLAALIEGDANTQDLFVRETGPYVIGVLRRYLKCEEDIKDCLQETFLRAFNKLHTFKHESEITTWLVAIAKNCALMKLRKLQAESAYKIPEESELQYDEFGMLQFPTDAKLPHTQQRVEERDLQRHIRRAVRSIPEVYQLVIMLRDIEGYSTKEAAQFLAISEGAVKVRLHRARLMLRDKLLTDSKECLL